MKVKYEVDMSEFYDDFENVVEWLKDAVRQDIQKALKKDPRYKAFVAAKVDAVLGEAI